MQCLLPPEEELRQLVPNPKAVRTWPQQHMPGFDAQTLPDGDLDALMAVSRLHGRARARCAKTALAWSAVVFAWRRLGHHRLRNTKTSVVRPTVMGTWNVPMVSNPQLEK